MINNPGNMRASNGSFQNFDTADAGLAAMRHDLLLKVSGNSNAMKAKFGDDYQPTLANVISTWAPPSENDTGNYIGFVSKQTGIDPTKPLSASDVDKILPAMVTMEQGAQGAKKYADAGNTATDAQTDAKATFNVTLPNGKTIEGVPVGTTKEQLRAKLQAKGIDIGDEKPAAPSALGGAISDIASNTMENVKNAATSTGEAISEPLNNPSASGAMTIPDAIIRTLGKAGNVIGGTMQAAFAPVTGALTASVEPAIPAASRFVKGLVPTDPRFEAIGPGAQAHQVAQGIGNDLSTAVGLGMAANQGAGAVRPANPEIVNKVGTMLSDEASGGAAKTPLPAAATLDEIKTGAKAYYDSSEAKGGMLNAEGVGKAISEANKQAGFQSEEGKLFAGDNVVTKTLDDLGRLDGKPLSLKGAGEIDDTIGDRIGAAFRSGNNDQATKLMAIRDTLRDAYKQAGEGDMVNPSGFADWRTGDQLWTAYRSAKDVQDIIKNGELADVPSTAIKNGFKAFIKNEKNLAPFTPSERLALAQAAKTGLVTGALKSVGSKIITGFAGGASGFAGGGIPGALVGQAAGQAAGYPFRAAATAIQRNKGLRVGQMVGSRPEVQAALKNLSQRGLTPMPQKPMLSLPAPKIATDRYGQSTYESSVQPLPDENGVQDYRSANTPDVQAAQRVRQLYDPIFQKIEAESAAAKQMQMDKLFQATKTSPEDMVSAAAQKFQDAGLPIGEVGQALLRIVKNQEGSIPQPRFDALYDAAKKYVLNVHRTVGIAQSNEGNTK